MKKKLLFAVLFTMVVAAGCSKTENLENPVVSINMGLDVNVADSTSTSSEDDTSDAESEDATDTADVTEAADATEDLSATTIEAQISVFVANKDSWFNSSDYDTFCYAVTDFNQDGQLELAVSSCQGTGLFSYNQFYTVGKDNGFTQLQYKSLEEGDSEPDILCDELVCYYDANKDVYHYIVEDIIRNGAAEAHIIDYAMSFDADNMVETERISACTQLYYDNPDGDFVYEDKDGNEITEEEYNNIEKTLFSDLTKKQCLISWIIAPAEDSDFEQLLSKSWEEFAIR